MSELIDALNQLQKEKHIEKEVIMQAIEDSLVAACNRDFGKNAIVKVNMDRETGDISVFVEKTVVEEVEDTAIEISLGDAKMIDPRYELGDVVNIEVTPKNFGRIAAQHARSVIVQKIKEEERRVVFEHFAHKEKDIVTGVVQRCNGKNISVSLDDKTDAVLTEKEQVKGEVFKPTDRIKLYIVEVKSTNKGPKILVSRTHPELVKRLFEKEVAEVYDGTVEIRSIAREAGSRTKIAVYSNDPNVDPVGACVGVNGARVNAIVNDLHGEKIDIVTWSDDPAVLIENALSPSNVVSVRVDEEEKSAKVVVPDYQLSLAIGKEGQNARLAAKLTGYKIDIKSESQAEELAEELDFGDDFDSDFGDDFDSDFEGGFDGEFGENPDGDYEDHFDGESGEDYDGEYAEDSEEYYDEDSDFAEETPDEAVMSEEAGAADPEEDAAETDIEADAEADAEADIESDAEEDFVQGEEEPEDAQ